MDVFAVIINMVNAAPTKRRKWDFSTDLRNSGQMLVFWKQSKIKIEKTELAALFLAFSFLAVLPLEKNTCPRTLSPARQEIELNCISSLGFTGNIAIRNALLTLSNLPELLAHSLRFKWYSNKYINKFKARQKKKRDAGSRNIKT